MAKENNESPTEEEQKPGLFAEAKGAGAKAASTCMDSIQENPMISLSVVGILCCIVGFIWGYLTGSAE